MMKAASGKRRRRKNKTARLLKIITKICSLHSDKLTKILRNLKNNGPL
jgi:hypothetical protein